MSWDVFISHASEDKLDVARSLADMLSGSGVRVWYDETTLFIGDRLLEKIDHGLKNSRYGVVIFSPYFIEKTWPKNELDGLIARETTDGKALILPVWHNITKEQVMAFSLTLAGRKAELTSSGLKHVTASIVRKVCSYQVQNHHDQTFPVDVSACECHGEPIVPNWLADDNTRIGNPWLAECLLAGTELRLYQNPNWSGGTYFVVDVRDEKGVVPNPDQFLALKPLAATTTTSTTTTAQLPQSPRIESHHGTDAGM